MGDLSIFKYNRRRLLIVALVLALFCLAGTTVVVWRVEKAIGSSRGALLNAQDLGVEVRELAAQPNPGFAAIGAPAQFKSAAQFDGYVYVSGATGLNAYSADGKLEHIYRTGLDLPAAPLGRMATGMIAGSRKPELLIATLGAGVLAFDGTHFRQIAGTTDESRRVTALLPLSSGRLLFGTDKLGLLIFDGRSLKRFHSSTDNIYVTALAGTEGDLWIGTLNAGLLFWHGGQTQRIGEEQGLPDSRVDAIALANGKAYAGTPMGIAELRDGQLVRVLAKGSFAHALLPQGESLLVGSMETGVSRISLSGQQNELEHRRPIALHGDDPSGKGDAIETIEDFFAVEGKPYAVSKDALLEMQASGAWRKVSTSEQTELSDGNISALLPASDGRLWVGYFDRGLDILPSTGGKAIHIEDEHVFCVNRIAEDPRTGVIAVATANGLVLFDRDGRQKQVLGRDAGLIADHVTDVALYGDGMALATPAGITFLDHSGAHSLYAFQGLVNNHVYALGADGNRLVAGTLGGVSLLNYGAVQRNFTTANSGLKHNWITAFAAEGHDWLVGTYGAGILRLAADGAVTSTEATRQGVVVNPGAMISDGRVALAGTLGQGLLVGDAAGARWRTVTAGLPSLNVTAIAIRNGVVYVGTENGLVKIPEDKL